MEREEAEARIVGLLREIRGVVEEYGGTSGYLNMTLYPGWVMGRPAVGFNNRYWPGGEDEDRPLNFIEYVEGSGGRGGEQEEDPVRVP